jgi:uncharacterized membrane protein
MNMTESFFKNEQNQKVTTGSPESLGRDENVGHDIKIDHAVGYSEESRLGAILSYIPFLCLIPLLSMKENTEIRLHVRQGVVLFIIELVAGLFLIDRISDFVFTTLLVAAIVLALVGLYYAAQGKSYRLPFISDIVDKTKF